MKACLGIMCAVLIALGGGGFAMTSGDGYIRRDGNTWTMGTASVERVIALEDSRFILKSLKSKAAGREIASAGSEELAGKWKLIRSNESKLKNGELQLDVTLQRGGLEATKSYVVYRDPSRSNPRDYCRTRRTSSRSRNRIRPRHAGART